MGHKFIATHCHTQDSRDGRKGLRVIILFDAHIYPDLILLLLWYFRCTDGLTSAFS